MIICFISDQGFHSAAW